MFRKTFLSIALCLLTLAFFAFAWSRGHRTPVRYGNSVTADTQVRVLDAVAAGSVAKVNRGQQFQVLAKAYDSGMKDHVLVQLADGTRGWMALGGLEIPAGTPLIKSNERASFTSDEVESKLLGKGLDYIQRHYAVALQLVSDGKRGTSVEDGDFTAVFPFRVYRKGEGVSSKTAVLSFTDGKVSSVTVNYADDRLARNLSLFPLSYWLIDKGVLVKAPQYEGVYDGSPKKDKGFLAGVLLSLIIALFSAFCPVFIIAPVINMMYRTGDWRRWWARILAVMLGLVSVYVCFTISIYVSEFTWLRLIGMLLATALSLILFFVKKPLTNK